MNKTEALPALLAFSIFFLSHRVAISIHSGYWVEVQASSRFKQFILLLARSRGAHRFDTLHHPQELNHQTSQQTQWLFPGWLGQTSEVQEAKVPLWTSAADVT